MPTGTTNDLPPGITIHGATTEQKLFGRFTLRRVLGRGGMGVVWLAHDEELKRNVAMKFLPDMIIRDREAVEDLKRETRRSLDLTHHHIVRIYDFNADDQCAAIVMEYVDGESLSGMKTHQAGGCFSVSAIENWVSHFCQAMEYAHRQARVVHRDLKPANLMVNGRGDLKVTDFGISRSMSDSMTRVSMSNSAGTLAYMSPEQALGSPPAPGDDIYALGATLYDLLTGRPPFFRGNLQVQLETVVPPPMEARRTELGNTGDPIPALWEEVIAACLCKRQQDRPQGMMEIANLLGVGGGTSGAAFRLPSTRGGGDGGPATSPTGAAPATSPTQRQISPEEMVTQQNVNPPPTAPPASPRAALQATRAEDVYVNLAPHLAAPVAPPRPQPIAPPTARIEPAAPVVAPPPPPEPEPVAEIEPEPAIVVPPPPAEEIIDESMTMRGVPAPVPVEVEPPVVEEAVATISMPVVEPPAPPVIEPEPEPEPVFVAPPTPPPAPPPPRPHVSEQTKIGHAIGSHAVRKSSSLPLILAGVGVIVLAAALGIWSGHRKTTAAPDTRKIELASHLEAAGTALNSDDLATATSEIAAAKALDPTNEKLGELQAALQQKEDAKAQQLAAAAKAEKERQVGEQREKERLAKLAQENAQNAQKAEMLRKDFDAALAKADTALSQRDPAAARQSLTAAQQLKPNDEGVTARFNRLAKLEDELKPKPVDTTPTPTAKTSDDDDTPEKIRHKTAIKEPPPKPKQKSRPEPDEPRVVQRPPPPANIPARTAPVSKPPVKSFDSRSAPGG